MPIYEYECKSCHRRTERRQKFSDPEITACPHCGGPIARVLSAPAFSFAGGGWYKDLYSSAKPPAAAGSSGDSKGEGATGSAESKGEAKPDSGSAKKEASTPAPAAASSPAPAATGSGSK